MRATSKAAALPLVVALGAGGLSTGAAAAPGVAPAAPPSATAAQAALAAWARGPWRYQGELDAPALRGRLFVSLGSRPDGSIVGEALLLDGARRLIAASSVDGRIGPDGCHLRLALPPDTEALDGTCNASLLAGRLTSRPPPRGPIAALFIDGGGRATHGEAWIPRDDAPI